MASYLGDYVEDEIIHFMWSSANKSGASITRATNGEVRVYKDNGVSQSTAGVTDTEDFDSLTGVHVCTIDLSADAFYAVGADYTVVLQGATIDGEVVNAVLAHFSIENRYSVLDEPLSGHQVQGTAGAAITLIAYLGPRGPGVYIDDGAGNTDTVTGEDGTLENPVSTIAAATTIATALGVKRFYLTNNTALTLAQTYEDYEFVGIGMSNQVDVGSQDVDNTEFHNVTLTGTQGGTQFMYAFQCRLQAILSAEIIAQDCWLTGDVTLRAATNQSFDGCKSSVPGGGTPSLIFPGSGTTTVNFRHYSGGLTVESATVNDTMSYESDGQIIIDATCTSLTVHIRGNCSITDNGTTTALTEDAAINRAGALADLVTILADTDDIQTRLPAALVGGRMDSDAQRFGDLEIRRNTAQGGTFNSLTLDAGASANDDEYNGLVLILVSGTGAGQSRLIADYAGSITIASVVPDWKTTPDGTTGFLILALGHADVHRWLSGQVNATTGGRVDSQVSGMGTNVLTNTAIAAGAIGDSEVATDLDTYQVKAWIIDDEGATTDRWMFSFFKNGKQITSGVTVPTLWVYTAAASPADLVGTSGAPQALTEAGSTETWFHNEATNRIADGTAYLARVRFTVDGSEREWVQPIGRDSGA